MMGLPSKRIAAALVGCTLLAVAGVGAVAYGPAANAGEASGMNSVPKTDIEALGELIALPIAPRAARWETREQPGGADWSLIAILDYAPEDFDAVLNALEPTPKRDGTVGVLPVEWEDLAGNADLEASPTGLVAVQGGVRDAEPFLRSPLLQGFAVALPENQLLLQLSTS